MARERFIINTTGSAVSSLIASYFGTGNRETEQTTYRDDKQKAITIEPVKVIQGANGAQRYEPDWEPTDIFRIGLGFPDQPPTGGTFSFSVSAVQIDNIPYDIDAAGLQAAIGPAFSGSGYPTPVVTLLSPGVFQLIGSTNGAIDPDQASANPELLQPECDAFVTEEALGGALTKYKLFFVMRQAPVVYGEPSDPLPAADVEIVPVQSGSASANKIQMVRFTAEDTYAGSFNVAATTGTLVQFSSSSVANPTVITFPAPHGLITGDSFTIPDNNGSTPTIAGTHLVTYLSPTTVSIPVNVAIAGTVGYGYKPLVATCGVAKPGMTAEEFATVLSGNPQIYYRKQGVPDNVSVEKVGASFVVTFLNSLGASNVPSLAVTNIDLVAPQGVSGTLNFNTIGLYKYSVSSDANVYDIPIQIQRQRASGEVSTIYGSVRKISDEIIDVTSMVPTPRPSYLTADEIYANFAALEGGNDFTGDQSIDGSLSVEGSFQVIGSFTADDDATVNGLFSPIGGILAGTGSITFAGPTAPRVVTLPNVNFTAARTDESQTFSGTSTTILQSTVANGRVMRFLSSGNTAIDIDASPGFNPGFNFTEGGTDKVGLGYNSNSSGFNRLPDTFELLSFTNFGAIIRVHQDSTLAIAVDASGNVSLPQRVTVGPLNLKSYTVSTLPTGTQGDTAYVTDALTPTYLGILVGGGSVKTPVFYNGTDWVSF